MIGGLTSFYRARKSYKTMVELGGVPWSSSAMTMATVGGAVAVLLSVVAIVHAYTATGSTGLEPVGAGSCWAGGGGTVWQVSCDLPHSYTGTALITDGGMCPNATDTTVALGDGTGRALCLAATSVTTG